MGTEITTALSTAFTGIKTDALSILATIIPIGLAVTAAVFGIKRAVGWFKSLAKG